MAGTAWDGGVWVTLTDVRDNNSDSIISIPTSSCARHYPGDLMLSLEPDNEDVYAT